MKGHSIAGMSITRNRVDDDFYATPESSTRALLSVEKIIYPAWEPACGDGAIAKFLTGGIVTATDLINRGYGTQMDFLDIDADKDFGNYNTVITNPPFSLFTEFFQQGLAVTQKKLILFGKLQALEGNKRASALQNTPLRTVYVFKSRQNPLRNGSPTNENGKPWASTMAFAWFVWEIDYRGKPQIEWI